MVRKLIQLSTTFISGSFSKFQTYNAVFAPPSRITQKRFLKSSFWRVYTHFWLMGPSQDLLNFTYTIHMPLHMSFMKLRYVGPTQLAATRAFRRITYELIYTIWSPNVICILLLPSYNTTFLPNLILEFSFSASAPRGGAFALYRPFGLYQAVYSFNNAKFFRGVTSSPPQEHSSSNVQLVLRASIITLGGGGPYCSLSVLIKHITASAAPNLPLHFSHPLPPFQGRTYTFVLIHTLIFSILSQILASKFHADSYSITGFPHRSTGGWESHTHRYSYMRYRMHSYTCT